MLGLFCYMGVNQVELLGNAEEVIFDNVRLLKGVFITVQQIMIEIVNEIGMEQERLFQCNRGSTMLIFVLEM